MRCGTTGGTDSVTCEEEKFFSSSHFPSLSFHFPKSHSIFLSLIPFPPKFYTLDTCFIPLLTSLFCCQERQVKYIDQSRQ